MILENVNESCNLFEYIRQKYTWDSTIFKNKKHQSSFTDPRENINQGNLGNPKRNLNQTFKMNSK